MKKAIWIEADGTETEIKPNNGEDFQLKELQGLVRSEGEEGTIDIVTFPDDGMIMVVNDNGIALGLDVNDKATKIYQKFYTPKGVILGNVLYCPTGMVK